MDPALQTMINNMPEKTGKTLEEWIKILQTKNFEKHGQAVKYLKEDHEVTHGFANTIVTLSKQNDSSEEDLVQEQYKGKESLIPIYDLLLSAIKKLGDDIKIAPKKTSVSLISNKQFALIKPATKTRIDLGLKIKDKPTNERLQASGPFGSMCTHRVCLSDTDEVDDELMNWIKEAYLTN